MKIKMLISMILLLGFSTGSINSLTNDEALTVSFNKQSIKAITYDEKIKLNKDFLTLFKNAQTNLSIAEEKLDRESYEQAKAAVDNIKYNFIKDNFQSQLEDLDSDIIAIEIALEESKRIEEEKAAQLAAIKASEEEQRIKETERKAQSEQPVKSNSNKSVTVNNSNKNSKKDDSNNNNSNQTSVSNQNKESKKESSNSNAVNDSGSSNDNNESGEWVKVGEGDIPTYTGRESSGRTYEHWSFEGDPSDLGF